MDFESPQKFAIKLQPFWLQIGCIEELLAE